MGSAEGGRVVWEVAGSEGAGEREEEVCDVSAKALLRPMFAMSGAETSHEEMSASTAATAVTGFSITSSEEHASTDGCGGGGGAWAAACGSVEVVC